jgi:hypothetical protein
VKRVAVEKIPGAIWMKTGYLLGARITRTLLETGREERVGTTLNLAHLF